MIAPLALLLYVRVCLFVCLSVCLFVRSFVCLCVGSREAAPRSIKGQDDARQVNPVFMSDDDDDETARGISEIWQQPTSGGGGGETSEAETRHDGGDGLAARARTTKISDSL